MVAERFIGLATVNPLMFLGLILGAVIFVGIVFGIAILVGAVLLVIIGLFLPAIVLGVGIWQMTKGNVKLGLLLVALAGTIWYVVYSGWVKFG